jgi:DNA-binding transcriptional MocR family regulator
MNTTWLPSIDGAAGPKHQAIKQSIRAAIAEGRLAAGHRLPPVREVAWRLGVTPGTVARAYKDLVDDGALDAQVGRGTFVAEPGAARPAVEETPYLVYAPAQGEVNMRAAQVADVGQGEVFHRLLAALPPPAPGAYASYPAPGHDARLRGLLADWFSGPDHGEPAPEDMVLTLGAQHALVVLFTATLHGPRPMVATEELAYPGIRHAAALLRAGMVGLPFDDEGLLPDALDRACIEHGLQVLVTSAEAHNPTTMRTSPARRAAIVEVARHHGLQIVDDDCFGFDATAAPSYRVLAPERTWVISSLSKTVSPDLRLGAIIAPRGRSIVVRSAAQQQYFGLPRPVVDLVTAALEGGEAADIAAQVRAAATARVAATRAALGTAAGLRLRDDVPFAWLPMPRGWRASSFLRAAEAEGIRLKAADEFALVDGRAPNAVRLALTAERDDARFAQAVETLARLLATPPLEVDV